MDAVEEVKSRLSIEDVVGEYMELKRAGRNYKALSPFSNEKTPSFMVSPEKQIWHDFSSGKGGNMFSFVMEMEGLDFKGALELLARKAGVDLSQYRNGAGVGSTKIKARLHDVIEASTKFYQVNFSKNTAALEYILKKRGYTKKTALDFRIGYAPTSGHRLIDFLKKRGFTDNEIKQAGLSTVRRGGPQDMFRGRIMVPLMDAQGRVVGFTARLLKDEPNAPKYINTPATMLYDKGRQVFGLHLAKEAIRKENFVVVVEGNLDVIASHQAGITNVVASAGTAMTENHFKELSKFTNDVRLSFDQDSAGIAATERAISLASVADINLSIITVPAGKDPDELIKQDKKLWQQAVSEPKYALDWLIEKYTGQFDITSAQGKKDFAKTITPTINKLKNKVEQEHYVAEVAKLLNVSKSSLEISQVEQKTTYKRQKKPVQQTSRPQADATKTQNQFFALVLFELEARRFTDIITEQMISGDDQQKLLKWLKKHKEVSVRLGKTLPRGLQEVKEYITILTLVYEELYSGLENVELHYEVARLKARIVGQYVKKQKAALSVALSDANEKETTKLLTQVKELDSLLKHAAQETIR